MKFDAQSLPQLWVYLSGSPLTALFMTLLAYQTAVWLYQKSGNHPLVNPVLVSVLALVGVLKATGLSYAQYFEGAQFVHFLLGTATVALAVPIYQGLAALKGQVGKVVLALTTVLVVGGTVSIAVAVGVATVLGVPPEILLSLWPKSVTTPIAMGISERLGAIPTLTAVFAILTGIVGAAVGTLIFNQMGLTRWWVRGFAMGISAHGVGTARAFAVHPEAGRFASLGMGLHGVLGAVLIPWAYGWIN
jgi:predicted murein hydrolase (TIGR00659 family)